MTLWLRSRPIPSRLGSVLASTRLPATERDSRSCPCSWPFRKGRERRAVWRSRPKKRRQAYRRGSAEKGRPRRVPWTSALALWHGQSRGAPHASKVCPFLFPLSQRFPFLFAICVLWRPHCERFPLLPLPRRDICRQGDAPFDLFPLFASCLG